MDIKYWPGIDGVSLSQQEVSNLNIDAKSAQEVAERAVLFAYNGEQIEIEQSPIKVTVKALELQEELQFSVAIKLVPTVSGEQIK